MEKKLLCKRSIEYFTPDIEVEKITSKMVLDYLNSRLKKSNNSFNVNRKNLLAFWKYANTFHGIENNPVKMISKMSHTRSVQYTPPREDISKVLEVATDEEKVFLLCFLHTAGRRSEIFRLKWKEDINFKKREIRLGTRKTKDSSIEYTWLPMNSDLYSELKWWNENRPLKESPYVFCVSNSSHESFGKPFTQRRRFLKGLCQRAGVKEFGFHALRRYVASTLADTHKVSAKTIQRILRHKSVTTTVRGHEVWT
ncbi:MAG: site-specific integrase [Desulfobulbaceae bacterium]|nr:site-specific integrase [Desulfobulbaceae bacterium]